MWHHYLCHDMSLSDAIISVITYIIMWHCYMCHYIVMWHQYMHYYMASL